MAMPSQTPGDAEEKRIAAAGVDALLDEALEVAHADVAGDQVGERLVAMPMNGLSISALRNAGPLEQGPVRGPVEPLSNCVTALGHRCEFSR